MVSVGVGWVCVWGGGGEALSYKNLKLFTKRLKFWRSTVKLVPRPFLSKKLTVFDDTDCPTSTLNQNTPDTQAEKNMISEQL